jgi:hypothetical protein
MNSMRAWMIGLAGAVALSLLGSARGADAPVATHPAPLDEAGFVALFNGQDLSGWHFGTDSYALPAEPQKVWAVDNGVIKLLKNSGKPNLISQWDYEDFELRLEWRVMVDKDFNSGIFVRCLRNNVRDNQLNLKLGDEGHFVPVNLPGAKAVPDLQKPPKEWNEWRVRAVGDKLTLTCNGKPAWDVSGFKSKRGYIGLQAEYFPFEFRNLRIKEIGYDGLNDLAVWNGKGWKVQGDVLTPGDGAEPLESKTADYKDYHLRFEWRTSKGANGACYLRGTKAAPGALTLAAGENDGLPGQSAAKNPDNPKGQWNYCDVTVADGKATVLLNGVPIADKATLEPQTGAIGLSPNLEYRNIRIKKLDSK